MSSVAPPKRPPGRSSALISRNVTVNGHRTSVRLESAMWESLDEIAHRERKSLHAIYDLVAASRPDNLSFTAALRGFLVAYYRAAATEEGHLRAGHGVVTSRLSVRSGAAALDAQGRQASPRAKSRPGTHQERR